MNPKEQARDHRRMLESIAMQWGAQAIMREAGQSN